jgi:hypothetical protein
MSARRDALSIAFDIQNFPKQLVSADRRIRLLHRIPTRE